MVYSILPTYGVIIRTAAEGKKAAVLDTELRSLIKNGRTLAKNSQIKIHTAIFTENSRATTILRACNDSFSTSMSMTSIYEEVCDYVSLIARTKR